jgi:hypothetical protein
VTTFYSIDRANAQLPEVRGILEHLQSRRVDLIDLRDRLLARRLEAEVPRSSPPVRGAPDGPAIDPESPRLLEARIRAVVDQMEAGVARLVELDVQLRDIEQGLIDFPALSAGRAIWLCWQLGEPDEIHFWHDLGTGYAARRPLIELT